MLIYYDTWQFWQFLSITLHTPIWHNRNPNILLSSRIRLVSYKPTSLSIPCGHVVWLNLIQHIKSNSIVIYLDLQSCLYSIVLERLLSWWDGMRTPLFQIIIVTNITYEIAILFLSNWSVGIKVDQKISLPYLFSYPNLFKYG